MLISGFTIIRNGLKYDFPFIESFRSILPVCDEFVINVGISDDDTKQVIEKFRASLPPKEAAKIITFETEWPLNKVEKRQGGQILADQTNLALDRCRGDWCLYLQADEVLHEDDLPLIRQQLQSFRDDKAVEGLVFQYVHFYGTYNVWQTSRSAYRREIRAVRNGLGIRSTGDAQSFRHPDGRKVTSVLSKARIFHYGWVRPQEVMKSKTAFMDTLYHQGANAGDAKPATGDNYLYKRIVGLRPFKGSHPAVMRDRVAAAPEFDFAVAPRAFELKDTWKLVSGWIERFTGLRLFEYRNYKLIRR
jgi:glycosyltransferase involved in cell wall biosynthesis